MFCREMALFVRFKPADMEQVALSAAEEGVVWW